jgi:hypothetical protein
LLLVDHDSHGGGESENRDHLGAAIIAAAVGIFRVTKRVRIVVRDGTDEDPDGIIIIVDGSDTIPG